MAAGRGPAKTHHRAEAGEQKHLVQLMPHVPAVRSGKNLIIHHLAVLIHGHVHEQTVRKRKFGFVLFGRPVAGLSESASNSAGCIKFSGTSFATAFTEIPGTIMCSTTTKTRIAEKNPPVAGAMMGRKTLSVRISMRLRAASQRRFQPCVDCFCAAATLMRIARSAGGTTRGARESKAKACDTAATLRGTTRRHQGAAGSERVPTDSR